MAAGEGKTMSYRILVRGVPVSTESIDDLEALLWRYFRIPSNCRRRRVAEQFAWTHKAQAMVKIYEQVRRSAGAKYELPAIGRHRSESI